MIWVPCTIQETPTGYLILHMVMFQCYSLNLSHPLLPALSLQVWAYILFIWMLFFSPKVWNITKMFLHVSLYSIVLTKLKESYVLQLFFASPGAPMFHILGLLDIFSTALKFSFMISISSHFSFVFWNISYNLIFQAINLDLNKDHALFWFLSWIS